MPYEKFNKKRRQWEDNGVLELIKLWKVCAYELRTIKRNGHLYVAMAKQLTGLGVPVTALEVHFKVNNLTQRYRQEQKTFEATGIISTWKFYNQVDDVFKSLGQTGYTKDKRIMTPASNASNLPSSAESPVWKNQMSQQEFSSNNAEGFYKSEYGMHRHFIDHTQAQAQANGAGGATGGGADVNFMANTAAAAAAVAAASRLNESNQMDQLNAAASAATSNNATNGGVLNYNKIKKSPDDYDKFVDIVKNIVDTHKTTPDKVDTFGDFIKSYIKRWPDRLQDEAINHITNYIIVKNMEHTMHTTIEGVNNRQ